MTLQRVEINKQQSVGMICQIFQLREREADPGPQAGLEWRTSNSPSGVCNEIKQNFATEKLF